MVSRTSRCLLGSPKTWSERDEKRQLPTENAHVSYQCSGKLCRKITAIGGGRVDIPSPLIAMALRPISFNRGKSSWGLRFDPRRPILKKVFYVQEVLLCSVVCCVHEENFCWCEQSKYLVGGVCEIHFSTDWHLTWGLEGHNSKLDDAEAQPKALR